MKKKNNNTIFNYIIYAIIGLIIIIAIYMYVGYKQDQQIQNTYTIELKGSQDINLYEGDRFVEPGYSCLNYLNENHNQIDYNNPSDY